MTIWTGTQKPHPMRKGIAELLDVPEETVRVIFVGDTGSYGRSAIEDSAADAALISAAIKKPVRVQWMRSDLTRWGPKAPAYVSRFRGAVGKDGKIAALDLVMRGFNGNEIYSRPDNRGGFIGGQLAGFPNAKRLVEFAEYGRSSTAYEIANVRAVSENVPPLIPMRSPLRTAHLRDPEGPQTTFALESFMDELAAHAGIDPVEFRIRHLASPRMIAVVRAAAEKAGWDSRPSPRRVAANGDERIGRGVACAQRGLSLVATVAEVAVNVKTGGVRVRRLVCANDYGLIVNPRSLQATVEANLVQSMSRSLFEEVRFDRTTVTSHDWLTYPIAHMHDIPAVDVILIDRKDQPAGGAGEPASRPTAGASANAIFDATGARVRRAPFTPKNVLAALHTA